MSKKLKVSVEADASGFKKEMAAAKAATKDFAGTVGDISSEVEEAFGAPVGAIADIGKRLANVGQQMKGFAATGESSFQKVALAAGVAAGAIAGIALTGLITAFKTLNAQAEQFRGTVEGTKATLQSDAYLSTYTQKLNDLTGYGKAWDSVQKRAKKSSAQFGANLGSYLVSGALAGADMPGGGVQQTEVLMSKMEEAQKAAKRAEEIVGHIFDLTEGIKDKTIEWKERQAQVAELMLTASDKSKSTAERVAAVTAAMEMQKAVSGEQIAQQKVLADAIKERNDLASSSVAETDEQRNAYAAVADMQRDLNMRLREMKSLQNEIKASAAATEKAWRDGVNKAIAAGVAEMEKYNAEMDKAIETRAKMDLDNLVEPLGGLPKLRGFADDNAGLMGVPNLNDSALKGLKSLGQFDVSAVDGLLEKIDPSKLSDSITGYYDFLKEMVSATQEAGAALNDAIVNGMTSSFQYLADCLVGLQEFSGAGLMNALLSPLAEAAIKMGEILVSAGLASSAFKKLLTNPYTAIAAGAALIATGAAAKAGLQAAVNSATGTSYVASSVASSGYSSGSSDNWQREMSLKVTGTLTADGSKLVAVLNNEANRKRYTT